MFGHSNKTEPEAGNCPICDAEVGLDPTKKFGEETCSNCGEVVWLVRFSHGMMAFKPAERVRQRSPQAVLAEYLGVDESKLENQAELDLGIDSLDFVELVMELEEETMGV